MFNLKAIKMRFVFSVFTPIVCLFGLMFCLPSCWFDKTEKKITKLSGLVVINILSENEYNDCHIKDSINVPFDSVQDYSEKNINKDSEIVLYCSNYMCSASGFAKKRLETIGFKNVFVYEGGIAEWFQKGYPVVGPCNALYLKNVLDAPKHFSNYVLTAQELLEKMGFK